MSEPTVVCVLGMHRSGTSLVARVLNVLGVDLGPKEHLMRPSLANPAGYWESLRITEINDEILDRLGGKWSQPPELAPGWERGSELAEVRQQARELIAADFSDRDVWGFKDPRTCLTAPFWQRIIGRMHYVICLRNPLDVAASLEARKVEPLPPEQGVGLWLAYVRAALAATTGHPRRLVFYEDLMADPEPVVRRLGSFIGRDQSDVTDPYARAAIDVAMNESLWHHRTAVPNVVDAPELAFHVKAFYLALRQYVPGGESAGIEALDLLGSYAADAGRQLAELEADREELERVREQSRILECERAARERERAELENRLSELSAELERSLESHAEEQRHRRRLEVELETTRAALRRREIPAPRTAPAPGQARESQLVAEIRARARELVPPDATALVAGKGDDTLLQLNGCRAWHFPMAADGGYAGYHPASDTAVIAQLEALRARGADHLLLAATTLWWLDHYEGLRRHLDDHYARLLIDEQCAIYRLSATEQSLVSGPIATLERTVACLRIRTGRDPSILDWQTGLGIAERLPEMLVFAPPGNQAGLPYLDETVDVVVVASADPALIAEARRVAASALIRVDPSSPERSELEWLGGGSSSWGEDASVTLIPDADAPPWDATLAAFAGTLTNGFAGELSVIGDSATLGRATEQPGAAGVRVRPIEVGAGASLAERARAATRASNCRIHVFITAPSVPLPDWLPSILALFSPNRDAGVVGPRVLTSYGVLEEAGGVLAVDGSRRRRGSGDNHPDRPEYRFVQRVDFCSPPLLATHRDLFTRLAGFDERRVPAEALVDFSLRAGQAGAPVYYQPQARLVTIGDGAR